MKLPRGIDPELLVSQVKNTMPYLFGENAGELLALPPAQTILSFNGQKLDHFEYFRLCLSAHFLTVATPVPTDVDNQIRQKLWPKVLPLDIALEMSDLVIEMRNWNSNLVSTRHVGALTGHKGEWFTVACGAYCAMQQYDSELAFKKAEELFNLISDEVDLHSDSFGELWKAQNGIGCLIGSASIAHNCGDLDRVMDMWKLDVADPLRLAFYKLAATPFDPDGELRLNGRLWAAGELYKETIDGSSMALENHRHYALRAPKQLRESPLYLVPNGPFFDDWGTTLAKGLKSRPEDLEQVVEVLKSGWAKQVKSVGYGRGLVGIFEVEPKLKFPPSNAAQATLSVSKEAFLARWNKGALAALDDIPSRA